MKNIGKVACLSLIILNCAAMDRYVKKSAERILAKERISNTVKQQKKLIESFSEQDLQNSQTYPDDFSLVISALANDNNFPTLTKQEQLLYNANEQFHNVPGFKELFKRIVRASPHADDAHIRGALYELELALAIANAQDSDEEIVEFGKKIVDPSNGKIKRIIDIVTTERWIEGKDRSPQVKKLKELKSQLKSQKSYADEYNKEHPEKPIKYQVYFRNSVNEKLSEWLERQNISFVAPLLSSAHHIR